MMAYVLTLHTLCTPSSVHTILQHTVLYCTVLIAIRIKEKAGRQVGRGREGEKERERKKDKASERTNERRGKENSDLCSFWAAIRALAHDA